MGCFFSKPKTGNEANPSGAVDTKRRRNNDEKMANPTDIFAVSRPPHSPTKLPPISKSPGVKPFGSNANGKKKRKAPTTTRNEGTRGMVQYQAKDGYVAVFDTRVLQKYYIRGLIGQGRCSDIFRAEHKSSKQPYAVKAIDKLQAQESCDVELAVLRRVQHPNILELIEVFDCPDRVFFVLELATGGDLLERMSERIHFSEQEACHIIKGILEGLKHLHWLAIAHCDLRPENILLYHPGKDARAIIADFGHSIECRDLEGVVLTHLLRNASPEYLAPEVLARVPANTSVDLWSVGVLAFAMISSHLPFKDENRPVLMRKILRAQYSYDDSVSICCLLPFQIFNVHSFQIFRNGMESLRS